MKTIKTRKETNLNPTRQSMRYFQKKSAYKQNQPVYDLNKINQIQLFRGQTHKTLDFGIIYQMETIYSTISILLINKYSIYLFPTARPTFFVNRFLILFSGNLMNTRKKDIITGLLFIGGLWSFISGQFIFSTLLFGSAAIYTNIATNAKLAPEK